MCPLRGELQVPHSKYHAHRALILASLAPGRSTIVGLSDAGHVHHTVEMLRRLGTRIVVANDQFIVDGGRYHPAQGSISAGSSGTTLYFMIGLASLADAPVTITGQNYFQRRPVTPLLNALGQLGVKIDSPTGAPPIQVWPGHPAGGDVTIPGTLSQWVSGLLLLAPFATAPTTIHVEGPVNEQPYLRLTVEMMKQFGLTIDVDERWQHFVIPPNQQAVPTTFQLPPDIGSAAFGIAAGALHPSELLLRGLPVAATEHPEVAILDIVREMGVDLSPGPDEHSTLLRHDGSPLNPVSVDCRAMPDALPALTTVACFGAGTTVFEHIEHVRLKESDRAAAMLQLNRMGADLDLREDRLIVQGRPTLVGAQLSSFNDHRVLMSLAVAASRAQGQTTLTYPHAYRISYPAFLTAMNSIGLKMTEEHGRASPVSATGTTADRPSTADRPEHHESAEQRPICEWVRRWATERPHDKAVIEARDGLMPKHTWQDLAEAADRLSASLLDMGVARGERVAVQLPNWFEFVVATVAIAQIDAVCTPVMPIFRERELSFALRRSKARVLLIPDVFRGVDYRQRAAAVLRENSRSAEHPGAEEIGPLRLEHVIVVPASLTTDVTTDTGPHTTPDAAGTAANHIDDETSWYHYRTLQTVGHGNVDALAERRPGPESTAQLLFTSGTSGEPKGVLHTHRVLTRAALMAAKHAGLADQDIIFAPSPLAHQTGFLYGMWLAITLGAPQALQPIWDCSRALRIVREQKCTFVQAATPFLADLTHAIEDGDRPPTTLRTFVATRAAVPRGLAERASRLLNTTVCGAWGTTETCLGTLAAPTDPPVKAWGTDGRALNGVDIRITDDDGRVVGANTEGNFEVRGPTFFTGYLDRPDWTAEAFTVDGYFRTGDLGIIDESGYIRISGRTRDVINRGGEKIPVSEIEQLLYAHPSVAEVAIVAMPDRRLGERSCAFVTLVAHSDLTFRAMQKFLDSHQVTKHYWPERLEILDEMPRNPAGKIQKFLLRDIAKQLCQQGGSPS